MIAGCGAYRQVQDEGVDLTRRRILDFAGAGVTATDDAANLRTLVTIPGGGGGGAVAQISNTTLGSDAASIDITSISGAYNHLWLLAYLRGSTASTNVETRIRFNNDNTSSYFWNRVYGVGAAAFGTEGLSDSSGFLGWSTASNFANVWTGFAVHIPAYANVAGSKTCSSQVAFLQSIATGGITALQSAVVWTGANSLSAINRITVFPAVGNWVTSSQLTLYGVT